MVQVRRQATGASLLPFPQLDSSLSWGSINMKGAQYVVAMGYYPTGVYFRPIQVDINGKLVCTS